MGHAYASCLYHCVFSTSRRRNLIPRDLEPRLWPYIGGIARENEMRALAVGGIENHVHVLLSLPAKLSISRAMQLIKGGSSRWIHETFPAMRDFAWQEATAHSASAHRSATRPSGTSTVSGSTTGGRRSKRSLSRS